MGREQVDPYRPFYTEAAKQFCACLTESEMPTSVSNLTREHIEAFLEHLLVTGRSASRAAVSSAASAISSLVQ